MLVKVMHREGEGYSIYDVGNQVTVVHRKEKLSDFRKRKLPGSVFINTEAVEVRYVDVSFCTVCGDLVHIITDTSAFLMSEQGRTIERLY